MIGDDFKPVLCNYMISISTLSICPFSLSFTSHLSPCLLSPPGRCTPSMRELQVSVGLRLLLPCVQLSPRSCSWEHPPHRHTRQHHSDLEVTVTEDSLGKYICTCQVHRQNILVHHIYPIPLFPAIVKFFLSTNFAGMEIFDGWKLLPLNAKISPYNSTTLFLFSVMLLCSRRRDQVAETPPPAAGQPIT